MAVVALGAAVFAATSGDSEQGVASTPPSSTAVASTSPSPAAGSAVQAETLPLDPSKGQPFDDPAASGGRGLLLWADGAVTMKIAGPVDHPVLRVRGDQCAGAPSIRVRLNGEKVASTAVPNADWETITVSGTSATAENVISVAYFGDAGQPGCDRNLRLDWIAASANAAPDGESAEASPSTTAEGSAPEPTAAPSEQTAPTTKPRRGGLYVDPDSAAAQAARQLAAERSPDAPLVQRIAAEPAALWLGEWSGDVAKTASASLRGAARTHTRPVFSVYAIPGRDCGSYSAGGLAAQAYAIFIDDLATAIGDRGAIIVLEPDALAQADCLSTTARTERYALLRRAVARLMQGRNTRVYLDAGHAAWKPATEMAQRLREAGVAQATGFALNTSNFGRTEDEIAYGRAVAAAAGGKPFVIDTSRNGNGPDGDQWCNPEGRALGQAPTLHTGLKGVDAFLWVKRPGESDGNCNGGPPAGEWWQARAVAMARAAG